MKKKKRKVIEWVIALLLCYVSITCMVMRFAHPEYTETQLFLSIPKAFILDFE